MKRTSNPSKQSHTHCLTCGEKLPGKRTKYCSRTCLQQSTNIKHQVYQNQQARGLRRKLQLMSLLGNKCNKCGYDKNYAALSFHHLDPTTKSFGLDLRSCSNRTLDKLLEEVKKCELLCLNCHAEIHHPTLRLDAVTLEFPALTN